MIVVDASVLSVAVGDDHAAGDTARAELRAAGTFAAPDLVDVETLAVLRKSWIGGALSSERFDRAVSDLARLPFERVPARLLLRRAGELRANVSAYDACYVALAEALDCELLTADRRLANASGPRCVVRMSG